MDQKTVSEIERELEKAIAQIVIAGGKNGKYPRVPSRQTVHLMAKAAGAVYEAVVPFKNEPK